MDAPYYQAHRQSIAIALSLCLHLLLLAASHYLTISKLASIHTNYSISFQAHPSSPTPQANSQPATSTPPTQPSPTPSPSTPALPQPQAPKERPSADKVPQPIEKERPTKQQHSPKIDERGLYQTQAGKQAAAKLDLTGWIWDTVPQPEDETEESGKIIFEIKIDGSGEIIGVQTLEKTVSPSVEKIYKEALTELTFSRTADHIAYAPLYVGKVTFILRTR